MNKKEEDKKKPTVGEIMAGERAKQSRQERDVDGLVNILRKLADDLDKERAVEMDFGVEVEELAVFDYMKLTIESYHLKPKPKPKIQLLT